MERVYKILVGKREYEEEKKKEGKKFKDKEKRPGSNTKISREWKKMLHSNILYI